MEADEFATGGDAETSWLLSGVKSYKECEASDDVGADDGILKAVFKSTEKDGNVTNK